MLSKSVEDTEKIAKSFAAELLRKGKRPPGALVVGLSGDLGAGKTAFTKAVLKHLGLKQKVNSPTFIIMKKYPLKLKNHKTFFHFDAYRLTHGRDLSRLGWGEIVADKGHIVFVEWPEHVRTVIPRGARSVRIAVHKSGARKFKLK